MIGQPRGRLRVLTLVEGALGDRRAGPEIRGLELARMLAERHEVTVAARVSGPTTRDGLSVIPFRRRSLLRAAARSEVVLAPWVPPYLHASLLGRRTRTVADLYDPADVELAAAPGALGPELAVARGLGREAAAVRELTRFQLRFADALLCAGDSQRARLERLVAELPERPGRPPVEVVPLGLPSPPPPSADRPLRERFGLGQGDVVVLWWGTPWAWLDVETAVLAFERIAAARADVRLVISAASPPDPGTAALAATERARALAAERSLDGRSVFFLEEWVPYERRHEYLADADIGLTLHPGGAEARLAARARYMDYLWTGLPCVLSRGDELSERLAAEGFATLVEPGDVEGVAAAILVLAGDEARRAQARGAGGRLAEGNRWEQAAAPLFALIEDPAFHAGRPRRRRDPAGLLAGAAAYYAARVRPRRSGAGAGPAA